MDKFANWGRCTVSQGYDAAATSIVLSTGHGARLPAVPFNAPWWNSTDYPIPDEDPNREIVRVTAITTDTLTITRAQEGTSATTKNTAGKTYRIMATVTAAAMNEIGLSLPATGSGSPEGAVDGNVGRYYHDPATHNGWVKETAAGTLTGWFQLW